MKESLSPYATRMQKDNHNHNTTTTTSTTTSTINRNDDIGYRKAMTSGQKGALIRSRSLTSPYAVGELSSLDSTCLPGHATPSTSSGSSGSGGKYKMEGAAAQSSSSGAEKGKKPLRRQKSLAELFGVVIYKSKVQLQELFSRRGEHRDRRRRDASRDRLGRDRSPGIGVGASGGAECAGGSGVSASTSGSTISAALKWRSHVNHSPQPLKPRGPLIMSHPDLTLTLPYGTGGGTKHVDGTSLLATSAPGGKVMSPEDIFCVVKTPCDRLERPASSRSLDTLQRRRDSSNSAGSSFQGDSSDTASLRGSKEQLRHQPRDAQRGSTERLLKPDNRCKAKATLVKSNSDSVYRLIPPSSQGLVKACSDDVCFVRRAPKNAAGKGRAGVSSAMSSPRTPASCSPGSGSGNVSVEGVTGVNSVSVILDWLFVGSVEAAFNEPLLCALGVDAIVDLTNVAPHLVPADKKTTCPCTCKTKHFRSKLNLAIDDIEWENIEQCYPDVNAFLNGWRQKGRKVLVISYNGKSRAPALVAQYLMQHFRIPLDRALSHLRSRHPATRINTGFTRALQRLQKRMNQEEAAAASSASSAGEAPPEFPGGDVSVSTSSLVVLAGSKDRKTAWDEC